MKKLVSLILSLTLMLSVVFPLVGCSASREKVLKVYNLGEYMDEDVIAGFSDWYLEQTGEEITLEYKTYSTNEDMYTEVYKKKADYDVVCSSDYILSRMLKNDLLLPVDRELVYGETGESGVVSEEILRFVNDYENYTGDASYDASVRYSVPYMWGTLGIMYRRDLTVNDQNEQLYDWKNLSWDMLFNEAVFKGGATNKGYMKNSIRDAYASGAIQANKSTLSALSNGFTDYNDAYKAMLKTVINDTSKKNMNAIETTLRNQKDHLFAYESDDGKVEMLKAVPNGWYGLFWSCDAGYAMEGFEELLEGSSENIDESIKYATSLFYGVPVEGANVWVDSFVIPKYTKNERAAQYFLKYLCEYDNAYLNRDYAGCSSPVKAVAEDTEAVMRTAWSLIKGEEVEVSEDILEDVEYYQEFFSASDFDDFGEMFIEMLFPTEEILSRCAVMKDSDKEACIEMAKMWIRVKAS